MPPETAAASLPTLPVRVWDLPVRLFHWGLVASVSFAWISGQMGWMEWHLWAGQCVLALVLFRILWGVLGSESARFATFLKGPGAALSHLAEVLRRRPDHDTTHNAMGGWAAAVILLVLVVQVASGLFSDDEILTTGPLAAYAPSSLVRLATVVHVTNQTIVLIVVAVHVLAVLLYGLLFRRDLVRPMLTGIKQLPAGTPAPRMRSVWLALALFLLCAAAAQGIASLGG